MILHYFVRILTKCLLFSFMNQKLSYLSQQEVVLRDENGQLQKRLRELIDANKEVTANYQAVKKNHDSKRREFEEIMSELEEAKTACQTMIRQKKTLQTELATVTKQKTELQENTKLQEASLAKKEKELNDALTRLSDIIADYEGKLAKKDEQIWAMGEQLSESKLNHMFFVICIHLTTQLQPYKPQRRQQQLWLPLNSQFRMPHRAITSTSMQTF